MGSRPLVAGLTALVVAGPLAGQALWPPPPGRSALLIEGLRPSLESADATLLSAAWYLSARVALSPRLALQADLPFAHLATEDPTVDFSESAVGNPYLGLEITPTDPRVLVELGIRVPIRSDNLATLVGSYADLDRLEAWSADVVSIEALAGYRTSAGGDTFVRLRGGPLVQVDVGDRADESELLLNGAFQAGWEGRRVALVGGVTSLFLVSGSGGLDERTAFQGDVVAEARWGRWRPALTIFVPLDDDLGDVIEAVVGLRLGVVLH